MTRSSTRDKVLAGRELYALPQVSVEVLQKGDLPQTSAHDLSRIILRDPPITARLLRVANSGGYGCPGQVKTVSQAIARLGFPAVRSVVLSATVHDVMMRQKDGLSFDPRCLWQHALETAGIAHFLAGQVGFQPREDAFATGLLHDIGFFIMARACGDEYRTLITQVSTEVEMRAVEQEEFGIDHAEAAADLFGSWGLPAEIVDAVARHHEQPPVGDNPSSAQLVLILDLADRLGCHGILPRASLTRDEVLQKCRVVEALGLRPDDLSSADRWISANLAAIAEHLDIDIGSPLDILVRANQRLHELLQEAEALVRESSGTSRDQYAREVLDAICATFSHYINNATTTILGHAELVQMSVRRGALADPQGRLVEAMRVIEDAVVSISAVLTEMKQIKRFEVVSYHDRAQILDIDEKLRRRVAALRTR